MGIVNRQTDIGIVNRQTDKEGPANWRMAMAMLAAFGSNIGVFDLYQ